MLAKPRPAESLQWFPEARFGMFIHFGLYAIPARGEWVMLRENIMREDYEPLMKRFRLPKFDADEWVDVARRSGCRYITITAKHHDGFCLFASELTDYTIANTPFKRDLIGELVQACHRADMPICFYYSQPDWHHPNFVHRPGAFKDLQYERPEDTPDWDAYLDYYIGQVRELCSNYGRIDGIWFDGVQRTEAEWRGKHVYDMIKKLQPSAVVNDRAGYGDFFTPERTLSAIPAAAGYMVEACQSISGASWGYHGRPDLYSTPYLLSCMLRMICADGNYLLNVGPKPDGSLPEDWIQRLLQIGSWLDAHGDAVYKTRGLPLREESDTVLYTRRGKKAYVHLLAWPQKDSIELTQLKHAPVRARLLATGQKLGVDSAAGLTIVSGLPAAPPDPWANVIELSFRTEDIFRPVPRPEPAPVLQWDGKGSLELLASQASVKGFGLKGSVLGRGSATVPTPGGGTETVETFSPAWQREQKAEWTVDCAKSTRCTISLDVACPEMYAGGEAQVKIGTQKLSAPVPSTGDGGVFERVELGEVKLPKGRSKLTLSPSKLAIAYHFATVRRVVVEAT